MHNESMDFIKELKFTKIHVFPYSDREGTVASKMNNKVDGNVKKKRVNELLNISKELEKEYYSNFYGRDMKVLIEEEKEEHFIGFTPNYIKVKASGNYATNEEYSIVLDENNITI